MRRVPLALLAAAACALAACSTQAAQSSPAAAESASVHSFSGLRVIPVTLTENGRTHTIRAELAETPQQQAQGLMFRREMGADEGMLFPSDFPQVRSFWMRNTVIPLDLLFIGADGFVSNIAANAVPYSEDSIPSDGPVVAVLELAGGRAAELGITAGARVTWDREAALTGR